MARNITSQYDTNEERRIAELESKIEKLKHGKMEPYNELIGRHRQFLKDPPDSFEYKGLFKKLCKKIFEDDYVIIYMVTVLCEPRKDSDIELVYLFKGTKESYVSIEKCRQYKRPEKSRIISTYDTKDERYSDWPLEPFSAIGFDVEEWF